MVWCTAVWYNSWQLSTATVSKQHLDKAKKSNEKPTTVVGMPSLHVHPARLEFFNTSQRRAMQAVPKIGVRLLLGGEHVNT